MNNDFIVPPPAPAPAPFNPLATPGGQFHPNQGAPRIERAVERATGELQTALAGLDKAFEVLINRLDPVLTPAAPPGPPSPQVPGAPKQSVSELVGNIERKSAMVNQLIVRIEAVTNRLEL